MSTTSPSPDTKRATTVEIIEVVAFTLAQHHRENMPAPSPDSAALAPVQDLWREDSHFRQVWRDKANSLVFQLEAQGVRFRASDSGKVKLALEAIRTIPARVAYELPASDPAFDQSDDAEPGDKP